MKEPLVSILIPAYNKEKWIVETVESALAQTWSNKEIIVVDDGSTDGTLDLLRRLESQAVKIVAQENQGACAARNAAYVHAQGAYIQWLDADDLLHPRKVELQLAAAPETLDPSFLRTAAFGSFFFRREKAHFEPTGLWRDLSPADWMIASFTERAWLNPTSWLVSRELTERAGPWDPRLSPSGADDGEYVCRLIAGSRGVKFFPASKCFYRIGNPESLNHNSARALGSLSLALTLSVEHLLRVEDSPRSRQAGLQYLQDWFTFFYGGPQELVDGLQEFASRLDGRLIEPALSWKYRWIRTAFGWKAAVSTCDYLRRRRMLAEKTFDQLMHSLDRQTGSDIEAEAPARG